MTKTPPNAIPQSDGSVLMTEMVLPSHTNAQGSIFGGTVMSWIDIACAIAAQRYSKSPCVTVSVDYLHFIVPIKIGYSVQIHASVTHAGKTSMETEATVWAENTYTGEIRQATHAYLTFVALDEHGRPKQVPKYPEPKTPEEKARYEAGKKRRERRLKWKAELDT